MSHGRLFRFITETRKNRWNEIYSYKENVWKSNISCLIPIFIWGSFIIISIIIGFFFLLRLQPNYQIVTNDFTNRHLLETSSASLYYRFVNGKCELSNTTSATITVVWETCNFEVSTNLIGVWITLYIIFTIIIFIALAVICDDFFIPCLEVMSEKMHLSEDVAGATFMAAGSSSPELFSSIAAVTFESDVGIGTITGSAVFNLLVIISLSAAVSKSTLHLDWRPITRDSLFYLGSILWIIFAFWDTVIHIYDAVVMILIYALYITFMVFNSRIMKKCDRNSDKCCSCFPMKVKPIVEEEAELQKRSSQSLKFDRRNSFVNVISLPLEKRKSLPTFAHTLPEIKEETDEVEEIPVIECSCSCCPLIRGAPPKLDDYQNIEKKEEICCGCNYRLVFILKWIVYVLAFPFLVMFSYTIIDCSKKKYENFFILAFIASIVWLGGLSFAMVVVVSRIGCLIKVDAFVMSLVILAAGTSLPDLLSSLIVAREGNGDMAVSNAIGSNVFDINTGLGFPYLIRIIINEGEPISLFSQKERKAWCTKQMTFMPHVKFAFILAGILVVTYFIFIMFSFKLTKSMGFSLFGIYILFLIYAFLQQFLCSVDKPYIC